MYNSNKFHTKGAGSILACKIYFMHICVPTYLWKYCYKYCHQYLCWQIWVAILYKIFVTIFVIFQYFHKYSHKYSHWYVHKYYVDIIFVGIKVSTYIFPKYIFRLMAHASHWKSFLGLFFGLGSVRALIPQLGPLMWKWLIAQYWIIFKLL